MVKKYKDFVNEGWSHDNPISIGYDKSYFKWKFKDEIYNEDIKDEYYKMYYKIQDKDEKLKFRELFEEIINNLNDKSNEEFIEIKKAIETWQQNKINEFRLKVSELSKKYES